MATGMLALSSQCHESTRTGESVSPTVSDELDPKYRVDLPPDPMAVIYSTTEAKIVQRPEMQQGAAAVSADSITSIDYVNTLGRIEELRQEENEDDRPSDHAHDLALKVLVEAARELGSRFPSASGRFLTAGLGTYGFCDSASSGTVRGGRDREVLRGLAAEAGSEAPLAA